MSTGGRRMITISKDTKHINFKLHETQVLPNIMCIYIYIYIYIYMDVYMYVHKLYMVVCMYAYKLYIMYGCLYVRSGTTH